MATRTSKRGAGTRVIAPGSGGRSPVSRQNSRTPGRRFRQRFTTFLRHPVDAAWGWLSSVRTAILLIASITVICLLGIYFVQVPGEALNDPTSYANWIQQNALPRYGSLTPLFDHLQFFTIFSSWYFLLLLTLLSLSIVVCTLNRAPTIWQNFKHPVIRRSDKFYVNALERASCSHADPINFATAQLRKRHYRVRSIMSEDDGPVTYLYANKNSWATLATFVFHAALVTLLMGGVLSQWHGLPLDSPARHILPAPLVSLSDNLAGFTFDQALPTGQSAVVYPRGTPHNVSFRVNKFTATFDPYTGLATDYVTDLSVYRDGQLVAHSNHLRVNDPLSYNGIIFHQSSLIPAVTLTVSDANGCLVCAQSIVLDQSGNIEGLQVDYANGVPIAGSDMTISVAFSHSPSLQLAQVQQPSFLISIGVPGAAQKDLKALVNIRPGQTRYSFDNRWTITVNGASEATVLLVTKDSGSPLIWPTAVILILSLCIAFYFPQRRIWLRIAGQHIQLAALHEHFTNIRTDLLAITRSAATDEIPANSGVRATASPRPSAASEPRRT